MRSLSPPALAIGLALAVTVGLTAGCSRPSPRPDVLLVTIDTLRSDHCSSYGYAVPTTPNLDALAGKGVRFEKAYAESSTTAPSHAVLMTGRHFRTFGLTKNGGELSKDVVTLAEAMRRGGYETAGFVSSFPLMKRFGFAQGFDVYDDDFVTEEASLGRRKPGEMPHDRYAGATLAHFERWLGQRKSARPLFAWVHFVDPHAPYRAPENFRAAWPAGTTAIVQKYDGEVHYADSQLGRLLEIVHAHESERGLLVIVTSDHGEGLGDHHWMSHGINLHEEAVRVPLVVAWQGHLPQAEVVRDPVGLIDVAPGILALVGIDAPSFSHGRSLFAAADPSRSIFLQRRDYASSHEKGRAIGGEMTAIVENGSKLILAPGEDGRELYDLASDPHELRDLLDAPRAGVRATAAGAAPSSSASLAAAGDAAGATSDAGDGSAAIAHKLESDLVGWKQKFPAAAKTEEPLDKESRKALRSLGYVD